MEISEGWATNIFVNDYCVLTLKPLTWKIWQGPNNDRRWQVALNSAFKGLKVWSFVTWICCIQPVDRKGTGLVTAGVGTAFWSALLKEM